MRLLPYSSLKRSRAPIRARKKDEQAINGVRVFRSGREVCDKNTLAGRAEYKRRIEVMWTRQKGRCCLIDQIPGCLGLLELEEATFEHQDGRGMNGGHRDDRIEKDGRPYNGAAHYWCNQMKGSRRGRYND